MDGATVIIGGTSGIGLELARECVRLGQDVVISGRRAERAERMAAELGGGASGIGVDLNETEDIAAALAGVEQVRRLVVTAIERDSNHIGDLRQARGAATGDAETGGLPRSRPPVGAALRR